MKRSGNRKVAHAEFALQGMPYSKRGQDLSVPVNGSTYTPQKIVEVNNIYNRLHGRVSSYSVTVVELAGGVVLRVNHSSRFLNPFKQPSQQARVFLRGSEVGVKIDNYINKPNVQCVVKVETPSSVISVTSLDDLPTKIDRLTLSHKSIAEKMTPLDDLPTKIDRLTLSDKSTAEKMTPEALYKAAESGDVDRVKLFLRAGLDPDNYMPGRTPLGVAVAKGHSQVVNVLINHGVNLNKRDFAGWTSLMDAAHRGYRDIVVELLQADADPDIKVNSKCSDKSTALLFAASRGHLDVIRELLAYGADPDIANKCGTTALFYAEDDTVEMAELLVEKGININARDCFGRTALELALTNGCPATAAFLLTRGAEYERIFQLDWNLYLNIPKTILKIVNACLLSETDKNKPVNSLRIIQFLSRALKKKLMLSMECSNWQQLSEPSGSTLLRQEQYERSQSLRRGNFSETNPDDNDRERLSLQSITSSAMER
nr:ankyrin repeat domain-containing protein [Endozoicomonas sp.]